MGRVERSGNYNVSPSCSFSFWAEAIDKFKLKREKRAKTPPEESEDSIASLLKVIHADIRDMKADLKESNLQIHTMNCKITTIERVNARTESETKLSFQAIRYDMGRMETSVTSKVINELDPKISMLRTEIREDMNTDLRRLVKEELQLQKYKENKAENE